jgi:hypothetical protein
MVEWASHDGGANVPNPIIPSLLYEITSPHNFWKAYFTTLITKFVKLLI